MAGKKTEQDQASTPAKATGTSQGDANQSVEAPAPSASSTTPAAQDAPALPGAGAASPGGLGPEGSLDALSAQQSISDLSADANGDVVEAPTLRGYLVTDVSSVLHDDTWYHSGDDIYLSDKEAESLLRRRIIEPSRSDK